MNTYLWAIEVWSQDGGAVSSFEQLSSADQEERQSALHSLPLFFILALLPAAQLLVFFGYTSFQKGAALQQGRVEAPQLVSGVQLGGRRRNGHETAFEHIYVEVLSFSLVDKKTKGDKINS